MRMYRTQNVTAQMRTTKMAKNTNPSNAELLANATAALRAAGVSETAIAAVIEEKTAPLRAQASDVMQNEIARLCDQQQIGLALGDLVPFASGLTVVYTIGIGSDFSVETTLVVVDSSAKKARKTGTGTGTRATSPSAGNVLVIGTEAFKTFSALAARHEVPVKGASAKAVWEKRSRKDPAGFPAPRLIANEDFYGADMKALGLTGYYEIERGTGKLVEAENVR